MNFLFKPFKEKIVVICVTITTVSVVFDIHETLRLRDKVIEAEIKCIVSFNGVERGGLSK